MTKKRVSAAQKRAQDRFRRAMKIAQADYKKNPQKKWKTVVKQAWKKVYSWSSIAKRLRNARNYKLLTISVNLGYRFYAHRLHQFYNCDWQINPVIPNPFPANIGKPKSNNDGRSKCG